MVYGKQNIREQKKSVCLFRSKSQKHFQTSFCIVIVSAPKNNQCFDEMARKYFQNVSFTYYFTPRKFWWNQCPRSRE